jgi:uncharacterized membrane protein YoaK (UPF0700 family)
MSITSVAANNLILVVFVFVAGVALLYWISREAEAPSRQAKAD